MSGSRPSVNVRLGTEGAEKVKRDLEQIGQSGEAALKRVQTATAAASPELQKMAGAADVANRAFVGMGGSLGRVGDVAGRVSGVAGGITTGFLALGAAAASSAVAIAKAGDTYTATLAKLTSASGGISQAQQIYEGLFRLSQQTGIAVSESAGAFSRFAVAAKEVGATNDQVLRLVSGIQKAGIVAGASAEEAKAGAQQLAQALASGVLQGDELRSVLENMPQLAQALAREFGTSIAGLRKMGEEGKLTADQVLPRLLKAAEDIGKEFDKQPATMSRASDILIAATADFGARLDKITGLSETFAKFMLQGASALRSMGSMVAPSEREAADTAAAQAGERLRRVQAQAAAERAASAYGDVSPGMAEAIGIAEQDLREALSRQQAILREDRETRRADADDAARQQVEAQRQTGVRMAQQIEKDLKTESSIREKYRKQREEIDKIEASGARTAEQISELRVASAKEEAEALDKLKEKTKEVGRAAQEADAHVQDWYKAQEKAAQEAVKAQEKAAEAIRRYHEASFDAVAAIGERAMDRVGDALVQAFVSGEGAAVNFANIAKGVLGSVVADLAKLAVINPILNGLFVSSSGARPTLAAAFGGGGAGTTSIGLGDVLGLGSLLGGGGITSGLSGIGTSIFGGASGGFAGGAMGALPTMSPGLLGLGGTSLMGGSALTLGGALGGIGGGMAIGTLLNGLLGRSSAQSTNGMIGSGLGSLAGFLIGGPIGGLIGGALGGLGGGLIGPGDSVKGYGYQLRPNAQGLLEMGPSFYNDTGQAAFQEAAGGIANLNSYLGARGLTVGGASIVGGNKDGADYSNATAGSFAEGVAQLYYHSNDARLEYALAQKGNQFGSADAMQAFVEGFLQVDGIIKGLTEKPLPAFTVQMQAVNDNFDAAVAKAREYSLAEDELNRARGEAIAKLEAQRTEQLRQSDAALAIRLMNAQGDAQGAQLAQQAEAARSEIESFTAALDALGLTAEDKAARLVRLEEVQAAERAAIITRFGEQATGAVNSAINSITSGNSLLRELAYGNGSALAPSQKYFAAISDLSAAKQALNAGGDLSAYTAVAQAVLPVARDFLGTSSRYGSLAADVAQTIASKGGDANLAGILSANVDATAGINATLAAIGTQQISVQTSTLNEIRRLASVLEAMIARQTAA